MIYVFIRDKFENSEMDNFSPTIDYYRNEGVVHIKDYAIGSGLLFMKKDVVSCFEI